jgi:integrase
MSALRDALTDYVATLRALGTENRWPATSLSHFVDFVEREGAEFVTIDLAVRWAIEPPGITAGTRARRLGIVRGFAVWLHATDPRTQVPPPRLLPTGQRRPKPHIFTDQEIGDLTAAAHSLRSGTGLRCQSFATLIGLLVATGLRPGEALALDIGDVDLSSGVLSVRRSKFGRSRSVPIQESTREALAAYATQRDEINPQRDSRAFLVTGRGARIGASAARRTFAKLCQATGLRPQTASQRCGRGPRLQDARHTFATRRLIEWYRAERDVERLLPGLGTYLGHVRIEDTYWYIQAVPELLRLATERLEGAERGGAQ